MADFILVIFMAVAVLSALAHLVWFVRHLWLARGLSWGLKPSLLTIFVYWWVVIDLMAFVLVVFHNMTLFSARYKNSEAKENLKAVYTTQAAYFGEYHTYAGRAGPDGEGAFSDMGWGPEGDTYYSYYVSDVVLSSQKPGEKTIYRPSENWPLTIRPRSTKHGYTAIAIANIDGDYWPDVWVMNDQKELVNLVNDYDDEGVPGCCLHTDWTDDRPFYIRAMPYLRSIKPLNQVLAQVSITTPALIFLIPVLISLLYKDREKYRRLK